jgi:hypothetical protein
MDNYGTHKHEKVRRFLERHRRFKVHYIPTSSSWLNLVERWFAELSGEAIQRGSFASVPDLIQSNPGLHRQMECRTYALCLGGKSRGHLGQGRKVPPAAGRNLPRMHKTEKTPEKSRMSICIVICETSH